MSIPVRKAILSIKPYVPGKPIAEVQREYGINNIVKMASNENPCGPSPKAVEAMVRAATGTNIYPDGNCYDLKQAVARRLGVSEENLVFGNGADEIIYLLIQAYINPGDEVIIPHPSFLTYTIAAQIMGADIIQVPLRELTTDLATMADRITPKTRLVFVCNPNNPTGTIVTAELLASFLDRVAQQILVVIDEAYFEYVDSPDYPRTLNEIKRRSNVVILRTFSKIYALAGLRVGYGVMDQAVAGELNRIRPPFSINSLAQAAALASLSDEDYVRRGFELNLAGKKYIYAEVERLGLEYVPSQANFIIIKTGKSSAQVFEDKLRLGMIIRPGHIFGLDGYIRVTTGTMEQNRKFIEVLEKVVK